MSEPATPRLAPRAAADGGTPPLDTDPSRAIRLGLWILVAGFGGFMAWAALAPLDEGVPSPGMVSVESKRKRIDHLTGGIIDAIHVREGQRVREGDALVTFNETQSRAALNAVESQWRVAVATAARLEAERAGLKAIAFPPELEAAAADPEVGAIKRAQIDLFRSRRGALEGELAIIRESVRSLEAQLATLDPLVAGREKQVKLFNEQLASFNKLYVQNFVSRNQLIEVERQLAEVQTRQSEDLSNIAGIKARLAEFRMRGAQREIEYRREVETQFADAQKEASTLGERLAAQRDLHTRLTLRAPVEGTVVDLAFHTVGSVIRPGDRIVDIVPAGDDLMVEAQVAPQHVDRIRAGLPADVHFDAYVNRVAQPVVAGKVVVVSADALIDPRTGAPYYTLRVSVPGAEAKKLAPLELKPGMQATVIVKTGERSLLTYLLRPFLRSFTTAMRER